MKEECTNTRKKRQCFLSIQLKIVYAPCRFFHKENYMKRCWCSFYDELCYINHPVWNLVIRNQVPFSYMFVHWWNDTSFHQSYSTFQTKPRDKMQMSFLYKSATLTWNRSLLYQLHTWVQSSIIESSEWPVKNLRTKLVGSVYVFEWSSENHQL